MLHHHSRESSRIMIERPLCPKCQIRMMLLGVELSFAGPDLRTFECHQCELNYKVLAEDDPMRSNKAVGWIKSELRQPE
jgi:hypothetical protein